jgi:hypothetical protein
LKRFIKKPAEISVLVGFFYAYWIEFGSTDKPGGVCFQQAGRAGGGFAQA